MCDPFVCLKMVGASEESSEQEKRTPKKELDMHLQASINQQRAVKHYMITYLCNLCANQQVQMLDYVDGDSYGEEEEQRWQRILWRVSLASAAHA